MTIRALTLPYSLIEAKNKVGRPKKQNMGYVSKNQSGSDNKVIPLFKIRYPPAYLHIQKQSSAMQYSIIIHITLNHASFKTFVDKNTTYSRPARPGQKDLLQVPYRKFNP